MKSTQKVIKVGNSLAVTLPAFLVKTLGLKPGTPVELDLSLDATRLTYSFKSPQQLSLVSSLKKNRV